MGGGGEGFSFFSAACTYFGLPRVFRHLMSLFMVTYPQRLPMMRVQRSPEQANVSHPVRSLSPWRPSKERCCQQPIRSCPLWQKSSLKTLSMTKVKFTGICCSACHENSLYTVSMTSTCRIIMNKNGLFFRLLYHYD